MTTWSLTTSGACLAKAGFNLSSDAVSGANLGIFMDQAEGFLCAATRKDWITDYSTIKANMKPILAKAASSIVAMDIINYDMGGYTSRTEAQTMLDVLQNQIDRCITILEKQENQEAMAV